MPHTRTGHVSPGDDLGSNDEVKVFKDEGDREDEKISSENLLVEEKSSLIDLTESEEKNDKTSRADQTSVFGKIDSHVSGFRDIPGYLVSPYSYANGGPGLSPMASKMGLPPFFCHNGDPLTTPPPAHCGIPPYQLDPKTMGLPRPALYSFQSGQYPYPMLPAEMSHVTSWHTPSVYTASSGFRNPYASALPISTSLPSDFPFRFSQSILPTVHTSPHHVLNSPNVPTGSKPICNQDISTNMRYSRNTIETKSMSNSLGSHSECKDTSNDKKKPHIKKPLNAFMLYMKEMRAKVVAECTLKESAAINQILGRRWHELSREEQSKYYEKARQERQTHMELYPGWSARDNYGYVSKKKKRKKDRSTTDSGGNNMKKCRARFGLDQQNQWCKPCRRKKKCIRYMENLRGKVGVNNLDDPEGSNQLSDDDDDDEDDYLGVSCGSGDETHKALDVNPSQLSPGSRSGLSSLQSPTTSTSSPLNLLTTATSHITGSEQPLQHQQQQQPTAVNVPPRNYLESNPNMPTIGAIQQSSSSNNEFLSAAVSSASAASINADHHRSLQLDNRFSHMAMSLNIIDNKPVIDRDTKFYIPISLGGETISLPSTAAASKEGSRITVITTSATTLTTSAKTIISTSIGMPIGNIHKTQESRATPPTLLQRSPIGANPHDINNPLSINQLTKTTTNTEAPVGSMTNANDLSAHVLSHMYNTQTLVEGKPGSRGGSFDHINNFVQTQITKGSNNTSGGSNSNMVIGSLPMPTHITQVVTGAGGAPAGSSESGAISVT